MELCENHDTTIVVFNGDVCPFCKMEEDLKTIAEEVEKSMVIIKQIQVTAGETGLKSD
jgi:protein-disulfide isomerase